MLFRVRHPAAIYTETLKVKFYLDVPRHFWDPSSPIHGEISRGYDIIFRSISALGYKFTITPYRSRVNDAYNDGISDGIAYCFHAKSPGRNSYCVKPGPINGRWYIDPAGYSGWSSIALDESIREAGKRFDADRADEMIKSIRSGFIELNSSKYIQKDLSSTSEIDDIRDFIFYPLQVNNDEVMKHSNFRQSEVLRRLRTLAEQHQVHVVVKRHPLCRSRLIEKTLEEVQQSDFLRTANDSVHALIPRSRAVLVMNSGVGLEALVHGATVYSLAVSEYAHLTHRLGRLDDLPMVFSREPPARPASWKRQLGFLLDEFFVDMNDVNAVTARLEHHVAAFRKDHAAATPAAAMADQYEHIGSISSTLLAMEKQSSEMAEILLGSLHTLTDEQDRDRVTVLLARLARANVSRSAILEAGHPEIWRRYVGLSRKAEDLDEAEPWARRLAAHSRSSPDTLILAKILLKKGKRDEGMRAAMTAAMHPTPTTEALLYYGRKAIGRSPQLNYVALQCAARALALSPNDPVAMWLHVRSCAAVGKKDAALTALRGALEAHPTDERLMSLGKSLRAA